MYIQFSCREPMRKGNAKNLSSRLDTLNVMCFPVGARIDRKWKNSHAYVYYAYAPGQ